MDQYLKIVALVEDQVQFTDLYQAFHVCLQYHFQEILSILQGSKGTCVHVLHI